MAAACGDDADRTGEGTWEYGLSADLDEFTSAPFDFQRLAGAGSWSYQELREVSFEPGAHTIVATAGELCAAATDRASCEAEYGTLESDSGLGNNCPPSFCPEYLVINDGDDWSVVNTIDGLREFLAPVDTMGEAWLLASPQYQVSHLRPVDDGFEFVGAIRTSDCAPVTVERRWVAVRTDGSIEVIESEVASNDPDVCI